MSYCQKIQSLRASSICFRFTVPVMNNAENCAGEKGHIAGCTYWRLRNGSITLLTWFYQLGKLIKMRRSWLDAVNDFSPSFERYVECFICRHSRPLGCQMKRPDCFLKLSLSSCKPLVGPELCYATYCSYVTYSLRCPYECVHLTSQSIFQLSFQLSTLNTRSCLEKVWQSKPISSYEIQWCCWSLDFCESSVMKNNMQKLL